MNLNNSSYYEDLFSNKDLKTIDEYLEKLLNNETEYSSNWYMRDFYNFILRYEQFKYNDDLNYYQTILSKFENYLDNNKKLNKVFYYYLNTEKISIENEEFVRNYYYNLFESDKIEKNKSFLDIIIATINLNFEENNGDRKYFDILKYIIEGPYFNLIKNNIEIFNIGLFLNKTDLINSYFSEQDYRKKLRKHINTFINKIDIINKHKNNIELKEVFSIILNNVSNEEKIDALFYDKLDPFFFQLLIDNIDYDFELLQKKYKNGNYIIEKNMYLLSDKYKDDIEFISKFYIATLNGNSPQQILNQECFLNLKQKYMLLIELNDDIIKKDKDGKKRKI